MTNQQLIPTEELLNQWSYASSGDWREVAAIAARWGYKQGADEELEACCEWVECEIGHGREWNAKLRAARRPKPPSLKEQAIAVIENAAICDHLNPQHEAILRRALEQLDN
jgi:hypothetical protein